MFEGPRALKELIYCIQINYYYFFNKDQMLKDPMKNGHCLDHGAHD